MGRVEGGGWEVDVDPSSVRLDEDTRPSPSASGFLLLLTRAKEDGVSSGRPAPSWTLPLSNELPRLQRLSPPPFHSGSNTTKLTYLGSPPALQLLL